jgi:hypothetical protein
MKPRREVRKVGCCQPVHNRRGSLVFPLPVMPINAAVAIAPAIPPPNATPDQRDIITPSSGIALTGAGRWHTK